jgi:hypothetical protein
MARKYVYECDGCGDLRTEELENFPQGWGDVSIHLHGLTSPYNPDAIKSQEALLCGWCQQRLIKAMDVQGWSKDQPA